MDLTSRQLETIADRSPSNLRLIASALPIEPSVKGISRRWSLRDSTLILVSLAVEDRGFSPSAARALVDAVATILEELILTDGSAWLVVWSETAHPSGIDYRLTRSKTEALEHMLRMESDAWTVLDIRALVGGAMETILNYARENRRVDA